MATREEEILITAYLSKMHWETVNKKRVLSAMREYAREMSMGFHNFAESKILTGLKYTYGEMYDLYLESLNNKTKQD